MSLVMPGDRLQAGGLYLDGSGDHWAETNSGLVVPSYAAPPEPTEPPVGVDLFCGAGGFSLGFHAAGFHVAAASEWDLAAAGTYLMNLGSPDTVVVPLDDLTVKKRRNLSWVAGAYDAGRPYLCSEIYPDAGTGWISGEEVPGPAILGPCEVFYLGDVRNLTGDRILTDLGREDVDCVFGGPPCQGYSKASGKGQAELRHDGRNLLVFEFARLILETRAKSMVMENVPGILKMLTPEGVPVIDAFSHVLASGGFSTYDALRKSLLANVDIGAGGAMRRTGKGPDADEEPVDEYAPPTLFDDLDEGAA